MFLFYPIHFLKVLSFNLSLNVLGSYKKKSALIEFQRRDQMKFSGDSKQ